MCQWIAKKHLLQAIEELEKSSKQAINQANKRRLKNVIDPFQSLIIASNFQVNSTTQLQHLQNYNSSFRSISNAIGVFHQTILSNIKGWSFHNSGYDLINQDRKIIAEVKNKHNTMNSATKREVLRELETALRQMSSPDWEGYLVAIVPSPKKRYKKPERNNLFSIDGASFYHLVTGDHDALKQLFDVVCSRISLNDQLLNHCKVLFNNSIPSN